MPSPSADIDSSASLLPVGIVIVWVNPVDMEGKAEVGVDRGGCEEKALCLWPDGVDVETPGKAVPNDIELKAEDGGVELIVVNNDGLANAGVAEEGPGNDDPKDIALNAEAGTAVLGTARLADTGSSSAGSDFGDAPCSSSFSSSSPLATVDLAANALVDAVGGKVVVIDAGLNAGAALEVLVESISANEPPFDAAGAAKPEKPPDPDPKPPKPAPAVTFTG